jgi:HlyD family secretion protein
MKGIIQDINELSDSRELLESKPHKFVLLFLYIFMSLLVAALVWTYFGEKDVVVKANGNVRPNEGISFIRNKVLGKVERVNYKNGQFIKKGCFWQVENV